MRSRTSLCLYLWRNFSGKQLDDATLFVDVVEVDAKFVVTRPDDCWYAAGSGGKEPERDGAEKAAESEDIEFVSEVAE